MISAFHVMEVLKCVLSAMFFGAFALSVLVQAQDQSGFISIDCGIPKGSSYKDETTGINYISDADFIDTGVNANISPEINKTLLDQQYLNLRSFPDGAKSCYALKPAQGKNNKYLIRAGFLYGNYDNKNHIPRFDLYLGVNWWDTVMLNYESIHYYTEIIHVPPSDDIDICLVNTGFGTPFMSLLELRPLSNDIYVTVSGSLQIIERADCGLTTDQNIRFPDDVYDRIWTPCYDDMYENLSVNLTVEDHSNYRVPSIVMQTAVVRKNISNPVTVSWARYNPHNQFYLYLHFAEIRELEANKSEELTIKVNNESWSGPFNPGYLQTTTINSSSAFNLTTIVASIYPAVNSTVPPLLNAVELYFVQEFLQSDTHVQDIDAIMEIKSTYSMTKYWQGDPCAPEISIWEGLNCSYNGHDPPRIISLNLSSSGLSGPIAASISKLTMLEYLDLSNNSLTGPVPNFLSQLQFLRVLNLADNELSGLVPPQLIARSNNGSLSLDVRGNQKVCSSYLCKHKFIVPLAAVIGAIFILLIALAIFWRLKRRKQGSITAHYGSPKERQFAYSEVLNMTNNLERIIGKGNFGTVYHGNINDSPVAVKIFSQSYVNGHKQFRVDAKLITRIHHRNLTASFGYFEEHNDMGLIYEFMANGCLEHLLSGKNAILLSWQERLQIAMDVAQGLDYLHNDCNPPIIHGNLKPTNILLNENYQAKLVDFGLSNIWKVEGGTTEYLDPEYYITNKLTEKSDIFSFGVVLLQTIASRPTIINANEKTHISQWVSFLIGKGDIKSVVDPRLNYDYHIDSAWKAVELAMACVSPMSMKRPVISQVVLELNQCLAMEMERISRSGGTVELVTVNLGSGVAPQAR